MTRTHWLQAALVILAAASAFLGVGAFSIVALVIVCSALVRRQTETLDRHEQAEANVRSLEDALETARASEAKFRQAIENANDIIFTVDREGYCRSMNRAGAEVADVAGETPRGVHLTQLVAPEHREMASRELQRVIDGRIVPRFELDIISRQGKRLTLELDVHPIRVDSAIVGLQGIARDVTERRELQARLLQAQKMEAIGRLAAGVAHDFNNILTVVIGCADLAIQELESSSLARAEIEEIRRAASSAAALTRQLLIFSRKRPVRPTALVIDEVVQRLETMLQRLVGPDVVLDVRPRDGAQVRADASEIEQVILNLVVNARDAMPDGGKLTIQTGTAMLDERFVREHDVSAPGEFVTLAIADTGIGMTPEVQAQIFQPYFTTKDPSNGTGLGLATVQSIVQDAGGCVVVESSPERGTTFTVFLPRVPGFSKV